MRCAACDKILNNYELSKKFSGSHTFVDMCNDCSKYLIDDSVTIEANINYASLADLEEENYVEDRSMDYLTGREHGDEDEWT